MIFNYVRGLFGQETELRLTIKKLETENAQLRAENRALQEENEALREKYSNLEAAVEDRIAAAVAEAVEKATALLSEELAKAHLEIARLEAIIKKDSTNSSKPPSTNNRFNPIINSREKSGRPQGGQKGHSGHRLGLPENIDELEKKGIVERRTIDHTDGSSEYVSRFVIDVEVKVIITEHRYAQNAEIPENLNNEVSYGDNLKATSVLLLNEGIIAEKRMSDIIGGLTQGVITLSPATLENFQAQFAQRLDEAGELEAIRQDLLNGKVMHTDDTTMRCAERIVYPEEGKEDEKPKIERAENKSFRVTVRTHSNETSTIYTVNPRKNKDGIVRDGILTNFEGILSHDHESKFFNYGTAHAPCGEHLSRELKGLRDLKNIEWANGMRTYILGMNNYKNEDLASGVTECDPETLACFEDEYDRLINEGRIALGQMKKGDLGYKEFNAMLNRLAKRKDGYLLFMRDYDVPFTNNLSERDLRPEKTKEKVSNVFRSWEGIKNHTKNRSFISTVKKRGIDLFSAISNVIRRIPVFGK